MSKLGQDPEGQNHRYSGPKLFGNSEIMDQQLGTCMGLN